MIATRENIQQAIEELKSSGKRDQRTKDTLDVLKIVQQRVSEETDAAVTSEVPNEKYQLGTFPTDIEGLTRYVTEHMGQSVDLGRRSVVAFVRAGHALAEIRTLAKKKRGGWKQWLEANRDHVSKTQVYRAIDLYEAVGEDETKLEPFTCVRDAYDRLVRWAGKPDPEELVELPAAPYVPPPPPTEAEVAEYIRDRDEELDFEVFWMDAGTAVGDLNRPVEVIERDPTKFDPVNVGALIDQLESYVARLRKLM